MSKSSIRVGISPSGAIRQAGQIGKNALAKMSRSPKSTLAFEVQSSVLPVVEELDSAFRQYPDLFREPSQLPSDWANSRKEIVSSAVQTLLIRDQQTAPLLREFLLSDHRLHICAMADRLGDACRQIRKQNYQVIVLSIGEHLQDMVPLLDLMNTTNPRAKAVAVLDDEVAAQLQRMIHPKVFGYVAACDADKHLTDAVMEVSQGKFTASPAISDIVMRLTSNYLAERAPVGLESSGSRQTEPSFANAERLNSSGFASSGFASSGFASSHMHSAFMPSSQHSGFGEASGFSHRPRVNLALLSERERGILVLVADGLSSSDIGQQLAISVPTVNTHIRNIFTKLGVHTRAQAIHVGISQGMIEAQ